MQPYYSDESVTLYHGDSLSMPLGRMGDVVLTDPPYGIGERWSLGEMQGRNGSSRLWGKGEQWDSATVDNEMLFGVVRDRPSIVWGGNYYALGPSRCWLIWDKVQRFSGADAELAWTNLSGPVRMFRLSRIDAYVNTAEAVKTHPTEKPVSLMRWSLSLLPDGEVVDPFAGTGATLVAAKSLGRRSIGIEASERYCEIAARRLSQEVLDLSPTSTQRP